MRKEYIYYINGDFVKSSQSQISFQDGGFQRGNAIFETIRFKKNHLFDIDNHIERLQKGIEYLEFKINKTDDELIRLILETINKNNLEYGAINLMITSDFDMNNLFD